MLQIFRRTNSKPDSRAGFTLIELIVVVALVALISVFALPSVSNIFKVSLGTASRELASTVKEAYNSSVMTGKIYRLVIDIKENNYWVEAGPANFLLETEESLEREKRRRKFMREDEAPPKPAFAMDKTVTRSKKSLPRGVEFEDVVTEQSPDPVTEGLAYAHFFPHGITEQTIIHLKDTSSHRFSLVLTALVGKTILYQRRVEKRELARD